MRWGSRRGGVPHAERSIEPRIHRCSAFACADQTDFKTALCGAAALLPDLQAAILHDAPLLFRDLVNVLGAETGRIAPQRADPCAMVQPWSLNLLAVDDIDINLELIEWMAR